MNVYHEAQSDAVGSLLANGIKRTSRGDKGADSAIKNADQYLDERRPDSLKEAGVSRDDNVYAYFVHQGNLIDITDGEAVPLDRFVKESDQKVLEVSVDPHKCYVSDLDTYDALKEALESGEKQNVTDALAASYWQKLTPLSDYDGTSIRRPEIMVTYDVEPSNLSLLN